MSNRLQGKVALITGGTNGIGKAAVQGMTREGARVVFTGNNVEAGNQIASGTGATFIQHAVQDVQGWEAVKAAIRDQHGRLDVTFSNAGTNAGDSDIETVEVDAWKNLVDINLTGMMLAIKASIELMKANPDGSGGSIILNSSINGMLALQGMSPTRPPRARCGCWPNRLPCTWQKPKPAFAATRSTPGSLKHL